MKKGSKLVPYDKEDRKINALNKRIAKRNEKRHHTKKARKVGYGKVDC